MAQTTIQGSFLGDATVTGAKIGADFISAQTALTTGLSTTDEIIVSDAGVIKRMDISVLEIAATQITASGTLPVLNGSALTNLDADDIATGTVPPARLGSGSSITTKFLRGDGSWQPLTSAAITATSTGAATRIAIYDGTATLEGLAALTFGSSTLTVTGHILPGTNTTYDLGSSSAQWRNIYTEDFHLNNTLREEGNSIDGTKGDWTIQEGAEDLFIVNNQTDKKYKFTLVEVA